jgi:membrane protein YqaA with SNARE-associated domain
VVNSTAIMMWMLPSSFTSWVLGLGGPGLVVLGLVDNSFIPVPGSMDALTIVLSASNSRWWFYYALMATIGSVVGGYLTYAIGLREGAEQLERRLSRSRIESIQRRFERWGAGAVVIPAMLPPPVPMVPFLIAAGAMKYPKKRFVAALATGRAIRYAALALLGARFGGRIAGWISQYAYQTLAIVTAMTVLAIVFFLVQRKRKNVQHARAR